MYSYLYLVFVLKIQIFPNSARQDPVLSYNRFVPLLTATRSIVYRPAQPILDFFKTTIFMKYKCYNDILYQYITGIQNPRSLQHVLRAGHAQFLHKSVIFMIYINAIQLEKRPKHQFPRKNFWSESVYYTSFIAFICIS